VVKTMQQSVAEGWAKRTPAQLLESALRDIHLARNEEHPTPFQRQLIALGDEIKRLKEKAGE
jgi:hypothetical protein